jgi:4-hydroxythreonine-4-phosphate dehydrogenase
MVRATKIRSIYSDKSKVKRPLRIAITTGDADGIGTEIAAKALAKLRPQAGVNFYLWRSPRCPNSHLRMIDRSFKRITVTSWPEALRLQPDSSKELIDINSNLPPAVWVETAAQASDFGHLDGMATAPISKTSIKAAGFKDIGHTDILKRVSKADNVFMAFIGEKFNVLLATGHLSLEKTPDAVSAKTLEKAVDSALSLRALLPKKLASKPIGLLGLNPHAGEEGLIGSEESKIHLPLIKKLKDQKLPVEGPLVPDAAFLPQNWKEYSVYVANYHDQGLIPFKMIHGQETGVHISMGLPFIRTSVDHGTAKNIFGKDKADPSSMRLAIEWAIKLAKKRDGGRDDL